MKEFQRYMGITISSLYEHFLSAMLREWTYFHFTFFVCNIKYISVFGYIRLLHNNFAIICNINPRFDIGPRTDGQYQSGFIMHEI